MAETHNLQPAMYFSYGQFIVYDDGEALPACLWKQAHVNQGFARRESTVCFRTLLEFGLADLNVVIGCFNLDRAYERIIAVPVRVTTGRVMVEGPEEIKFRPPIALAAGNYRVVAAQLVKSETEEAIDVYFEALQQPLRQSQIILADEDLLVEGDLLETAEIA